MSEARSVELIEVGPRDGLQNESTPVALSDKVELIERLIGSGYRRIEATSFVNPAAIPQLADADQLLPHFSDRNDLRLICLVPNERGYDRAMAAGARDVEIFTGATDAFCQANIRCTIAESFERFAPVMHRALHDGVRVRGAVSVAFHCPYTGPVDPQTAIDVAKRLLEIGCREVSIADTIGKATPEESERFVELALSQLPTDRIAMHFHDTTGQALENIRVSWDAGISRFDSSVGGLGGCPFAPGAPGNVASEGVVTAFHDMGVETGIDLGRLGETSRWIRRILGRV